jgi:hypothetical protein
MNLIARQRAGNRILQRLRAKSLSSQEGQKKDRPPTRQ